jgi:hypothetical protein
MRVSRSAVVGVFIAIVGFLLAFGLAPFFDTAVLVYVTPAAGILLPVIGPLIPARLAYWLVPDAAHQQAHFLSCSAHFYSGLLCSEWPILLGSR